MSQSILVVSIEGLGTNMLGAYGGLGAPTPNLELRRSFHFCSISFGWIATTLMISSKDSGEVVMPLKKPFQTITIARGRAYLCDWRRESQFDVDHGSSRVVVVKAR